MAPGSVPELPPGGKVLAAAADRAAHWLRPRRGLASAGEPVFGPVTSASIGIVGGFKASRPGQDYSDGAEVSGAGDPLPWRVPASVARPDPISCSTAARHPF